MEVVSTKRKSARKVEDGPVLAPELAPTGVASCRSDRGAPKPVCPVAETDVSPCQMGLCRDAYCRGEPMSNTPCTRAAPTGPISAKMSATGKRLVQMVQFFEGTFGVVSRRRTKKTGAKSDLFQFFWIFLASGQEKNHKKKSARRKITKFGGWKDLIFLSMSAKNRVEIRSLEPFPLVCLVKKVDVNPWQIGKCKEAYYRGEVRPELTLPALGAPKRPTPWPPPRGMSLHGVVGDDEASPDPRNSAERGRFRGVPVPGSLWVLRRV